MKVRVTFNLHRDVRRKLYDLHGRRITWKEVGEVLRGYAVCDLEEEIAIYDQEKAKAISHSMI